MGTFYDIVITNQTVGTGFPNTTVSNFLGNGGFSDVIIGDYGTSMTGHFEFDNEGQARAFAEGINKFITYVSENCVDVQVSPTQS